MKGKLYIVSTPIGNLGDLTFRAKEILESVSFVLAEDTRVTKKLVDHYSIDCQLISYRDQNHNKVVDKVIEKLDLGLDIALVSDAGTPSIADPGYKLVSELKEKGFDVLSIPGPSAVIAALSVSGLPTDKFCFLGFLPKSGKKRGDILVEYGKLDATLIIYESPNRVVKLLEQINRALGDRKVSVANDLTKVYEEVLVGSVSEVVGELGEDGLKGEYVVLVGKG